MPVRSVANLFGTSCERGGHEARNVRTRISVAVRPLRQLSSKSRNPTTDQICNPVRRPAKTQIAGAGVQSASLSAHRIAYGIRRNQTPPVNYERIAEQTQ